MAKNEKNDQKPIVIRKVIKKVSDNHGTHGAWKIAYADFVTAMMAFFLLMWLISMVSEEGREGIARFFTPILTENSDGGAGGIMGGTSIATPGFLQDNKSAPTLAAISTGQDSDNKEQNNQTDLKREKTGSEKKDQFHSNFDLNPVTKKPVDDQIDQFVLDKENRVFEETKKQVLQAIQDAPELNALKDSLVIDQTPEGLRIQIVDQKKFTMFPNGSTNMYKHTYALLAAVSKIIGKLDNKITISGHTDSVPFSNSAFYNNWELSSDRANASRRVLIESGLPEARVHSVTGRASTEPLDKADPKSERNRRISIILRRHSLDNKGRNAAERQNPD